MEKIHNEELHNLNSSHSIARTVNPLKLKIVFII